MPVAPLPIEDSLFRVTSDDLETLGFRKNDWIEVVPLDRYEPGHPVLASIQGHFKIGSYHPTPDEICLLAPSNNGHPGKRYVIAKGDDVIGFVAKADHVADV